MLIIEESLNKNHMQLYGYRRETTPHLVRLYENGEIIKSNQAYSNHTHTMPVLSLALTEAAQGKEKTIMTLPLLWKCLMLRNLKPIG